MRTLRLLTGLAVFAIAAAQAQSPPNPILNLSNSLIKSGDQTTNCAGVLACAAISGTNQQNTGFGYHALQMNVTGGTASTAFGFQSLGQSTAHANTAFGSGAGNSVTTGYDNLMAGNDAMNNDDGSGFTTGWDNVALGVHSLGHLTSGSFNVGVGNETMVGCGIWSGVASPACLLTGGSNTAVGQSGLMNIQGAASENTALGYSAGGKLTTGTENIFIGSYAGLNSVTTGTLNLLIGRDIRVPSDTGTGQLNIGNLIKGTGLQQGGAGANGEVDIYGKLTASGGMYPAGIANAWLSAAANNEIDVFSQQGSLIAKFITSAPGNGGPAYPYFQANGSASVAFAGGGAATNVVLSGSNAGAGTVTLGQTGDLTTAAGPLQLKAYTVATLPTCNAGITGSLAVVTDATAPAYNGALTGGGAVHIPVFCTGSAWTAH